MILFIFSTFAGDFLALYFAMIYLYKSINPIIIAINAIADTSPTTTAQKEFILPIHTDKSVAIGAWAMYKTKDCLPTKERIVFLLVVIVKSEIIVAVAQT